MLFRLCHRGVPFDPELADCPHNGYGFSIASRYGQGPLEHVMSLKRQVRDVVMEQGADLFGVASVDRVEGAPERVSSKGHLLENRIGNGVWYRVVQFNCRRLNATEHPRGFAIKRCYECRRAFPHSTGIHKLSHSEER